MLKESEDIEITRKRLLFRSWHRGVKETDLVLGTFAERELSGMGASELTVFAALLEESDADIWDWLTEKTAPPRDDYLSLLDKLKQYRV